MDETNKKLIMYLCVGAPASGKSTWSKVFVKDNKNVDRWCPDEFRAKFGSGEGDQSVSYIAFEETKKAAYNSLNSGNSVIIDATNMYPKTRKQFLDIASKFSCEKIAVVFEVSKEKLIERNSKRDRKVPEEVIDNMLNKYQRPSLENEVDKIWDLGVS